MDLMNLPIQLDNYIHDMKMHSEFSSLRGIGDLAKELVKTGRCASYILVYKLLTLALVLPVATASVERAFSAMKIVKTPLRNKIGDQWLSDSMLVYIERDVFAFIDNEPIMRRFHGALFVHAKADGVTLSDIKHSLYVPHYVRSFFLLNGAQNYEGTSRPLLAVQATELADGIFIGCTMNHTVVDGTSFWHFFNSWSEISRGSDSVSKAPLLERSFFYGTISTPIRIPIFPNTLGRDQVFDDKVIDKINIPDAVPLLKERIFHFSREKIAQLKAKANAETETENPNRKISSLQAVLAHLWWSIIRIRIGHGLHPDKESSYRLIIGTRSRLNPPLPQQYFGNALQAGTVTKKAGDVLERGTGSVAWEMNKMVALHTEEKVRSFLECWLGKASWGENWCWEQVTWENFSVCWR
ncbi:hypothetical protein ACFX1X_027658 [Malus domestica]